jgi:type I restriction enzyme M protein
MWRDASVRQDMTQLGSFVWSIADQLRGVYKPAQYGSVVLPFTILRRMECVLDAHRDQVTPMIAATPNDQALAAKLRTGYGLHFWNRSKHTLSSLLGYPDNLADGLIDYVSDFSANVRDTFDRHKSRSSVGSTHPVGRPCRFRQAHAEDIANLLPATDDWVTGLESRR